MAAAVSRAGARASNKKAGAGPAFSPAGSNPANSVPHDDRTAPTIVDADQTDVDVLADAIGARRGGHAVVVKLGLRCP